MSALAGAAESLSPDLSRLNDLLQTQAKASKEDEEVKGDHHLGGLNESNGLHIDSFS